MARKAKILVYTSSADFVPHRAGGGHSCGTFLSEIVEPLEPLVAAGHELHFATPDGRSCVIDTGSKKLMYWGFSRKRRDRALAFIDRLKTTGFDQPGKIGDILANPAELESFDALFIPGGHAPMTDVAFANWAKGPELNRDTGALLKHFHDAGKPTALICHAPTALGAAAHVNGKWIYDGYRMTCVSLLADQLTENVPFFNSGGHMPDYPKPILERNGGNVSNAMLGKSYVIEDRELVTAQDLFSGKEMGAVLLKKVEGLLRS